MAERPAFFLHRGKVVSKLYSFTWFPGFAPSQKQKSIESLHQVIRSASRGAAPLEISTKSTEPLGEALSAFRLRLGGCTLENIFQSGKVFANGGPYSDLLAVPPKEAKRDPRLTNSGPLTAFRYQGEDFPLTPKTLFYDYIYLAAVRETIPKELLNGLTAYTHFTDIEFNPARSVNTQARTTALLKLLLEEYGCLPEFTKEEFLRYHQAHVTA